MVPRGKCLVLKNRMQETLLTYHVKPDQAECARKP